MRGGGGDHGVADWPRQFSNGMQFAIAAVGSAAGKESITGQLLWDMQRNKL